MAYGRLIGPGAHRADIFVELLQSPEWKVKGHSSALAWIWPMLSTERRQDWEVLQILIASVSDYQPMSG